MKRVYLFDPETHLFIGAYDCQLNPEEKGENGEDIFIEPEFSTTIEPPVFSTEEYTCAWIDGAWVLTAVPVIEPPIELPPLDPLTAPEKLAAFLNANADVRALIGL